MFSESIFHKRNRPFLKETSLDRFFLCGTVLLRIADVTVSYGISTCDFIRAVIVAKFFRRGEST